MSNKRKIVVVGGAGFIGSNIAEALLAQGDEVHVIDNLSGGKKENVPEGATLHVLDVREAEAIKPVFEGAEYVFHLAALPRVPYSIENPIETNDVNANGTLNVLVAAKEAGVRRVVYSASSAAYGEQEKLPLQEDMLPMPQSPYGLQKYIGEHYCRVFSEVYGLPTVSLRYFNVYGKGQDPDGPYALVIGKFLKQRAEKTPLTITGDGEQTRDFVNIADVVRANILASEGEKVGAGEVINIGSGKSVTINQLAELVGGPVEHVEPRIEPKHTRADISLARELLSWEPEVSFEKGIAELLEVQGIKEG